MPTVASKLADLDEAAARLDWVSAEAAFAVPEGGRLILTIEAFESDAGTISFEFKAAITDPENRRAAPHELWRTRVKKFSTALRGFARRFPTTELPPSHFQLSCRGAWLPPQLLKRLLLDGLAEAVGVAATADGQAGSGESDKPVAWPAILRSGADGLRKWNRLKAADRKAVDLSGADLSGLDLTGVNLGGVRAKRTSFAGATLARALMSEGLFDGADFSTADLQAAHMKGASAPEASFRHAKLAGAGLSRCMLFGASFAGAELTGADLSDANLNKADFSGATLIGAKLDRAAFDTRTAWPAGFAIPAEVVFAGRGTDPRLSGKGKKAVATDINGLIARLASTIDPKRMKRTLDMLKSGKNQLFAETSPAFIRGIVRSQREPDLVYSCVLTDDGTYACCTPDLQLCLGLRGEPCKHLLVLLIGLARAGEIDPAAVDRWVVAAIGKNHRWNKATKDHVSDSLLKYKGVQAGEVDWRPTETIPEDFYTM